MKFELFVGWRYLRKKKRSYFLSAVTVIAVLGVALSVLTVVVVLAVMNGFGKELEEKITGNIAPIIVKSYEGITGYSDLISKAEQVRGVTGAGAFIMRQGLLEYRSEITGVTYMGVDPEAYGRLTGLGSRIVSGSRHIGPESVLAGSGLAARMGLRAGSEVRCIGAGTDRGRGRTAPSVAERAVSGIFETGMYEYDNSLIYVPLQLAQKLFLTGEEVDGIEVRVADIYAAEETARVLEDALGPGIFAVSWMETHRNLFSALALEKKTMLIILSLIVVIAAFNIMSTLVMLVMEKTRDIGVLRAIGAGRCSIMKIFIIEGVLIGLLGVVLGSAGGFGLCSFLRKYPVISIPGDVYLIDRLPVSMAAQDFIFIGLLAFAASVAAAIYPAAKASSLSPMEALRYE